MPIIAAQNAVYTKTSASQAPVLRLIDVGQPERKASAQYSAQGASCGWGFIDVVSHGSRRFDLRQPLKIKICQNQEHMWEAGVDMLGILAVGNTVSLAMEELQEEFAVIWDGLAFESDDNLTVDAQRLKQKLRDLVKLQ